MKIFVNRKLAIENFMMLKKLKFKSGFSMIEVSIVLGVVSVGLLGVVSLVMQNINVQRANKNTLVASMLAQEGIELTRNVRDENWITVGNDWDTNIKGWGNNDFTIDYNMIMADANDSDNDGNIIEEANTMLYLNAANKFYTHTSTGNTATQYYRLITVNGFDILPSGSPDGVNDYYSVKSKVEWQDNGTTKEYVAETYLYNWR